MSVELTDYKGSYPGKRYMPPKRTLELYGENPTLNLMRLARKAEGACDYATATRAWSEILTYVEAKRKPTDPAEAALKGKQAATLDEITRIKNAILAGLVVPIDESTVIDQDAPVLEHQPSGRVTKDDLL